MESIRVHACILYLGDSRSIRVCVCVCMFENTEESTVTCSYEEGGWVGPRRED